MQHGTLKMDGNTADIIDAYLSGGSETDRMIDWGPDERPETSELVVNSIKILDEKGRLDTLLTTTNELNIEIEYELKKSIKDLRVAVNLL